MKLKLALFGGLALASVQAMACYTVFDGNSRVIYQGVESPVDMSRQFHETLGRRFPGAHMVFDQSATCTPVALAQLARPTGANVAAGTIRMEGGRRATPGGTSPLFTDRETAQRQNLPHTVVAGDVVLVPAAVAAARASIPSMTVVPADPGVAYAGPAADTRTMGAGPNTATMGAGPSHDMVITELRNGTTVVQRGGSGAYAR